MKQKIVYENEVAFLPGAKAVATSNKKTYLYNSEIEKKGSQDNTTIFTFELFNSFPDPFNPTATISYTLPKDVEVKLVVFNTLGKEVATLVDGYESAGYKSVTFDASNLPSGVYYYRLQADKFSDVKKMVFMK